MHLPWIAASLLSALFLGIYDLCKKHAVRGNAVLPVIFLSTIASATVWLMLLVIQRRAPGTLPAALIVAPLTATQHAQLLLKSAIVTASWICSYIALKQLPISLASPIAATGPIWTLGGALLVLGERPRPLQWLGLATTLGSFVGLSFAGRKEGIHFHRNRWVWFMMAGTMLGSVSALYDKFLLGHAGFAASTVQAWFSIYLVALFLPLALAWQRRWWPRGDFHWRWSIPAIGLTLLVADFVYFSALRDPAALVALVTSIRRGSALVGFAGGLLFFNETNGLQKLPAVAGVLAGIALTMLG